MNYKAIAIACNEELLDRTKALLDNFGTVINALMNLYQDLDKYKEDYKYGGIDTVSAYQALYRAMQASQDLVHVESVLDDVRVVLGAISDDLYKEESNEEL